MPDVVDTQDYDKQCEATTAHKHHPWVELPVRGPATRHWCKGIRRNITDFTPQDEKVTVETVDEAQKLLNSRVSVYGDRVTNMERTAALWSSLLGPGREIKDWEVPLLMSAYKMMRTFETPDYSDNSDDIDGWKKMFVEVMNANHGGIIQARTVEEYTTKKATVEDIRELSSEWAERLRRAQDDGPQAVDQTEPPVRHRRNND